MRLMPREQREAMFAVYRYCRGLDDIADGPGATADKLARLAAWRLALDETLQGREAVIPAVRALAPVIEGFRLEQEPLYAVIRGMEMDVRGEMRGPPLQALRTYAYCVAGAVGLTAVRIFRAQGDSTSDFARALGEALQLTNILRDVEEDAAQGRLYLPKEFLAEAGIGAADPRAVLADPRLPRACERLADLAAERYRDAMAALPPDPRPLRPAMIMMGVYGRLLRRLRRTGWQPRPERLSVPKAERLWIALRYVGPPATWPSSI